MDLGSSSEERLWRSNALVLQQLSLEQEASTGVASVRPLGFLSP
jgi:hypothetical protein